MCARNIETPYADGARYYVDGSALWVLLGRVKAHDVSIGWARNYNYCWRRLSEAMYR